MRDTNVGLLVELSFGKMACIGVAPGIYRFAAKKDKETGMIKSNFEAGIAMVQGSELELRMT